MSWLTEQIRGWVPLWLLNRYQLWRHGRTWFDPRGRSTQTVFREIYKRNLWGGTSGEFYSGPGSDGTVAEPYVAAITNFIQAQVVRSVVDIGCGDFRVGQALIAKTGVEYHGIDIVPELIASHQAKHGSATVSFSCCDATREAIPTADLCLIRQVLQHLSNAQVQAVLEKCVGFRWLIVTEHILPPDRLRQANIDIHAGVETRVDAGSCLQFDKPPFHWRVAETICQVSQPDGSLIQTVRLAPPA
jgi:SAM-dependent methyltransferase